MSPLQTPQKSSRSILKSREGSSTLQTAILIIGALLSLVLIYYAARSLIGEQMGESVLMDAGQDDGEFDATQPAPIQTIEQVLESVQVYVASEEYPPAVAILKAAVNRYPNDPDLRYSLGELYLLTQDPTLAYQQYQSGIEINSKAGGVGSVDPKILFTAGTLANTIGQPERALEHYMGAMQADPQNPDYPLYLANIQLKLNQLSASKASLAMAARLDPGRAHVWATWAQVALRENNSEIALQQIEKARQLEPAVAAWSILEAQIQKRAGNPERSIELLTALPDGALFASEPMKILAESYGMMGNPSEAASRMMDFASSVPTDPQAAFDTALWLQRAKQLDSARQWGKRARDLGHARAQGWLDSLPAP
ncbi:MAG: tetratricopeptide repeat protein [Phycisphaerales bacterium]